MRHFDQLDWVHRFDDFEMFMYVLADGSDEDGIYMQLLHRELVDGAETWNILYDRRLSSIIGEVLSNPGSPTYEDEVLRMYLNQHPNLVDDEKEYLQNWLKNNAN